MDAVILKGMVADAGKVLCREATGLLSLPVMSEDSGVLMKTVVALEQYGAAVVPSLVGVFEQLLNRTKAQQNVNKREEQQERLWDLLAHCLTVSRHAATWQASLANLHSSTPVAAGNGAPYLPLFRLLAFLPKGLKRDEIIESLQKVFFFFFASFF